MTNTESSPSQTLARLFTALATLFGGLLGLWVAQVAVRVRSLSLPLLLMRTNGLVESNFSRWSLIALIVEILAAPLFGYLGDKIGRGRVALAGMLVLGASIASAVWFSGQTGIAIVFIGMALGIAMLTPAILAQLFRGVGSRWLFASVAALYFSINNLSILAMAPFSSSLTRIGFASTMLVVGAITAAVGCLGIVILSLPALWRPASPVEKSKTLESSVNWSGILPLLLVLLISSSITPSLSTFLSSYATDQLGMERSQVMSLYSTLTIASILSALALFLIAPLADLSDWLTFRSLQKPYGRAFFASLGLMMAGIGLAIIISTAERSGIRLGLLIAQTGAALIAPMLMAIFLSAVPESRWAGWIGVYLSVSMLANNLSSWMILAIVGLGFALRLFILAAVILSLLALLWLSIRSPKPMRAESTGPNQLE